MVTLYQNFEIVASVAFYLLTKFLCHLYLRFFPMHGRKTTLSSIPERNEFEEERMVTSNADDKSKWVPKKKHEVLKAKYKCLKKLFQIYDASVIGILPEANDDIYPLESEEPIPRRKRRSHRTKTDACAATSESSRSDVLEAQPIAKSVIRDLNIQCSCSTQMFSDKTSVPDKKNNEESKETFRQISECEYVQTTESPYLPYPQRNSTKKLTRFQSFIQRVFGLRPEKCRNCVSPEGHVYAASDDNIVHHCCGNRRRKRLRFRGHRRPKKVHSEISLRDMRSPLILNHVQSVQRHYLMDTTPRQCPINGCRMMSYGLINYNDHLNLSHFPERKYFCHYCHEGFEQPNVKTSHENEHIGLTKLNFNCTPSSTIGPSVKKASKTQTEPAVSEEKLKKIVSFFDKIVENDRLVNDLKNNRYSDSNLQSSKTVVTSTENDLMSTSSSDKRTVSCGNLGHRTPHRRDAVMTNSETTSKCCKCHFCGEIFEYRRQLSLHVDLEHRVHNKFSKFHSCAGITNPHLSCYCKNLKSNVHSRKVVACPEDRQCIEKTDVNRSEMDPKEKSIANKESDGTLSCDPSTNIIFYETLESNVKHRKDVPEQVDSLQSHIDSHHSHSHPNQKFTRYKWEPGTKIIRV